MWYTGRYEFTILALPKVASKENRAGRATGKLPSHLHMSLKHRT